LHADSVSSGTIGHTDGTPNTACSPAPSRRRLSPIMLQRGRLQWSPRMCHTSSHIATPRWSRMTECLSPRAHSACAPLSASSPALHRASSRARETSIFSSCAAVGGPRGHPSSETCPVGRSQGAARRCTARPPSHSCGEPGCTALACMRHRQGGTPRSRRSPPGSPRVPCARPPPPSCSSGEAGGRAAQCPAPRGGASRNATPTAACINTFANSPSSH